jgi:hypothetical protein
MRRSAFVFTITALCVLLDLASPATSEGCFLFRRHRCATTCQVATCEIPCWVSTINICQNEFKKTSQQTYCWCCNTMTGMWNRCDCDTLSTGCASGEVCVTTSNTAPNGGVCIPYTSPPIEKGTKSPTPCILYAMKCDGTGHYRFATQAEVQANQFDAYFELHRLGTACKCN